MAKRMRGALFLALLLLCGCSKTPEVTITFGGDVMLAREGTPLFAQVNPWEQIAQSLKQQQSGASQSFFLANLESPVYDPAKLQPEENIPGYDLCATSDQINILKQGGIDLVNLVNNHTLDCGAAAAAGEAQLLQEAGIASIGSGFTPTFIDTKAGKLGFLVAEDVTAPIDEQAFLTAVRQARARCDVLIIALHWGNEYQSGTSLRQRELAQALADAGVDILWGTHPHVLQPMQWLNSSDGKHKTLVMYSLGNLLADQYMTSATQQTGLITIGIQNKEITSIALLPLVMDRSSGQLVLADSAAQQSIEDQLKVSRLSRAGIDLRVPTY
jgi:Putative enzyme of poly-gamma-glutamate biosynthesis (capsule formation)